MTVAIALLLAASAARSTATPPSSVERIRQAAAEVSQERIRQDAVVLASDAFEGRAPGTSGGERAAGYLGERLSEVGVEPLEPGGSYEWPVPLVSERPLAGCRLELTSLGARSPLALGSDYVLATTGAQTWLPRWTPIVFVGYGIVAPEYDYNDYADVDVAGRVVAFVEGEPRSSDRDWFAADVDTVYAAFETKRRIAVSRGAVGSILIPREGREDGGGAWVQRLRDYAFDHVTLAYDVPSHLSLVLRPDHGEDLFSDALYDFAEVLRMDREGSMRSFHLPVMIRFEGEFRSRNLLSPNLVGVLRGSDPRLAPTYVALVAHYDHLGRGPAVDGDDIYNGLVDNGLGVAGVLEIARVLADPRFRPRRSVLVILTTAEESGALGSRYLLDHLPVAYDRLVAAINVDGLAFLDLFDDVWPVGGELSSLGRAVGEAAETLGFRTSPPPSEAWNAEAFARSDQVSFADAGVPAILVSEGFSWRSGNRATALERAMRWMATRYHTVFDDADQPLRFDATRDHAAVVLATVMTVADDPRPPAWKPGIAFAYQRLLRLADEEQKGR
jgi:hypothetical protein